MSTAATLKLTEFIELSCHKDVIVKLDKAVEKKGFCTLLGPNGSGKTSLLDYWRRLRPRESHMPRISEILYCRLRSNTTLAVPMTCQLYARLWYAIQSLDRPAHHVPHGISNDEGESEIKMYNARQLQELFPKLIEKARRKYIRAVIIDNAHFLDATALEWLIDLRAYYDEQYGPQPIRSIILAGHRTTPAGKALVKNLKECDEIKAAWLDRDIEVRHLSIIDFFEAIAWLVPRNLRAEFAPDVSMQRVALDLWTLAGGTREKIDDGQLVERTGARWWEFTMIIEALDDELNTWDGKRARIITNDIIGRVKARLMAGQRA